MALVRSGEGRYSAMHHRAKLRVTVHRSYRERLFLGAIDSLP
jgi:hypothetical protein